ncbi:phenylacetaldoxime dehydratase family protein [Pseudomonas syringae group genomosp. 3]|uniref:Phenylacetaldoxime dehydratase n=1 Tax=Pseudomonas syringae pv. primulae TaxID=251707 RepID=A0A3M4RH55_9PSED|nr:phenylacetaldoxime dehydratase family protein [Pseudomonas syringae group genomosp. 3]RMR02033.1 Phenylacetaldoxime dehydratase [Pseudomonas syringae pv. primulae]
MHSAIPDHLRTPRTLNSNVPEGYQPPFPAWSARFDPLAGQVVMAYFGIQALHPVGLPDLAPITQYFVAGSGPQYWDSARCVDANGLHTCIAIAYWRDVDAFYQWRNDSGFNQWWQDPARETGPIGWFLEVVCPSAERFETLFSAPGTPEGVAHLATHMSEPILEHAYWGSSRDRIPLAQTDALIGSSPTSEASQRPGRVRVSGRDNLCLIRSGQDWSSTTGQERDLYLNDIQPVLQTGMTFLRDEGATVGCLNCRFMQALDSETGEPVEKSFGLAWFDDLANLERWAKTHPTHVAIFGGFMQYVQTLNFQVQLRLYHEIAVIPSEAQYFEYLNCHPGSGLLSR